MKIALIIPRNGRPGEKSFYDYKFFSSFLMTKKYFSYLLAVPTLASLTPPEHEIRIFDENIEEIDYSWPADLVGISVRTMYAMRAYSICAEYRKRGGAKIVLGGIHPSMCTEEALGHADAVCVGEAEFVWADILKDAENGALKRVYTGDKKADLTEAKLPGRSFLKLDKYFSDIVQTTKGCPFHCEFCSVYAYDGTAIRSKTVKQVVDEILGLSRNAGFKKKSIFFADDNIIANKKFARELFAALKPHGLNWSCQVSINVAQDDEMLKLMREAGCGAVLIGFESVSKKNLEQMDKGVNQRVDYLGAIKKIQSHGMLVHASFILGYDFDTKESFDELIAFVEESKLLMPAFNILTPFPGTKLFERMEREGRILHKDWERYDGKTVVFKPALLTEAELLEGFGKVVRAAYSFDAIYRKLNYYWDMDFWKRSNTMDPIPFKYRLLFVLRLLSLLPKTNFSGAKFTLRMIPKALFGSGVRISTVITLMAYNDFAYSTK